MSLSVETQAYAICSVPVAPLRAEPAHRSEMVSQLLWGERCRITETEKDGWVRVSAQYDGYEGWCQLVQLEVIPEKMYQEMNDMYAGDWVNEISMNGEPVRIPLGAALPGLDPAGFTWGNLQLQYKGKIWRKSEALHEDVIIRSVAFQYLHTPYLWGGKSVFGADCSGFVQTVFKLMDIVLPRDASQQAGEGIEIGFLEETRCGDLAFFDNEEGRITHVGILLGSGEIIHASGEVRVDAIDHQGIINSTTGLQTHRLRLLRRVLPAYHFI